MSLTHACGYDDCVDTSRSELVIDSHPRDQLLCQNQDRWSIDWTQSHHNLYQFMTHDISLLSTISHYQSLNQ